MIGEGDPSFVAGRGTGVSGSRTMFGRGFSIEPAEPAEPSSPPAAQSAPVGTQTATGVRGVLRSASVASGNRTMFGSHTLDDEGDPPAPDSTMFGVRPEDEASSRENPAVVTGNRIVAVGENANQASRRWSAAFGDSEGASARTVQLPGLPGLGPSPSQPASSKTMLGGVAFGFDDLESGDAQPAAAQPAPRRQMPEAAARFGSETQLTFGNSGIDRGAQTLPPGAVSGDTIVPSLAAHGAVDSGATLAPGSAPGVSSRTIVGSFAAGGFDAPVVPRVEPATPPGTGWLERTNVN